MTARALLNTSQKDRRLGLSNTTVGKNTITDRISVADRKKNLQDVFLEHLRKHKTPTTVFLVNGVKLQGIVISFDTFSLMLQRETQMQLVYKHAISTIMSNARLHLDVAEDDDFVEG